jgi:hypothetical protein
MVFFQLAPSATCIPPKPPTQLAAAHLAAAIAAGRHHPLAPYLATLPTPGQLLCPLAQLPESYLDLLGSNITVRGARYKGEQKKQLPPRLIIIAVGRELAWLALGLREVGCATATNTERVLPAVSSGE